MAKTHFLFLLAFGLWMASGMAFADPIITVDCFGDGSSVVQNPDGSVTFANCSIPGGGTMSGTDHVVQGPRSVTLIASPLTIVGPIDFAGINVGQVDYFWPALPGTWKSAARS